MVFYFNPKQFHPLGLYTPKQFMAQLAEEQSINKDDIQENLPEPDPAMVEAFGKKTTLSQLGESTKEDDENMGVGKLYGQRFRVNGGLTKPNNNKLRKFISLKL